MTKETKLFDLFHKKKYAQSHKGQEVRLINPYLLEQEIEKAIRFIKVKQFHSGFTEISSPEQGGNIEVTIHQDPKKQDQFLVDFTFMAVPGHMTLLRENKVIGYAELKRLANEYDKYKEQIDQELDHREQYVKSHSR